MGFLGKHEKTVHVQDPKPQRTVGISYVVPAQLPALPHITIRPEPSELLKSLKPSMIDLPETVWFALPVSGLSSAIAAKLHDEYIMHPPYPQTRAQMCNDYKGIYSSCKRLPIQRFPKFIKDGYIVICHFYLDESTGNRFPKNTNASQKAQEANLILTFRPHVDMEGRLGCEIEYFIPR